MAQKEREYFECICCGVRQPRDAISYDQFGYSVCPKCGYSLSPDVGC